MKALTCRRRPTWVAAHQSLATLRSEELVAMLSNAEQTREQLARFTAELANELAQRSLAGSESPA